MDIKQRIIHLISYLIDVSISLSFLLFVFFMIGITFIIKQTFGLSCDKNNRSYPDFDKFTLQSLIAILTLLVNAI